MPAGAVLVVTRFIVPDEPAVGSRSVADFAARAANLQTALATRPGHVRTQLARAVDDPTHWVLVSEWVGVGAWRRALSAYEVRIEVIPLMAMAPDEPAVYETPDG